MDQNDLRALRLVVILLLGLAAIVGASVAGECYLEVLAAREAAE